MAEKSNKSGLKKALFIVAAVAAVRAIWKKRKANQEQAVDSVTTTSDDMVKTEDTQAEEVK